MTAYLEALKSTIAQSLDTLDLQGKVQIEQMSGKLGVVLDLKLGNQTHAQLSKKADELYTLFVRFADQKSFSIQADDTPFADRRRLACFFQPIENLHFSENTRNLDFFSNDLIKFLERELKTRKQYRKRKDLPDPSRRGDAHVNRKPSGRKQVKFEMEPADFAAFAEFNKASGRTQRESILAALELLYESEGFLPSAGEHDLPEP